MAETNEACVSCMPARMPDRVDMARMKIDARPRREERRVTA